MPLPPKTWVEVSRAALRHNARQFRRALGATTALMAVVKSNAYGHGLPEVVRALKGSVDWFGVDALPEAMSVHRALPGAKVLILGVTPAAWLTAVDRGTRISISSPERARELVRSGARATVHLEVETGLTRQGIDIADLPRVVRSLRRPGIQIEGIFTHFANIDDGGLTHPYPRLQLRRFAQARVAAEAALGARIPIGHSACSAPGILFPETHFDLVRGGISYYGYWPSETTRRRARRRNPDTALRPVLTWKTRIAQVKAVARGTPISYGLTARMPRTGTVAVLPIGYWDGYDRGFASKGVVLIRGRRAPIIGRICMNMCMADVSGIPDVRADDEVVLLGPQGRGVVDAEELAALLGTISFEVLTRINPTLPRILV